jgi:hypothetical protein
MERVFKRILPTIVAVGAGILTLVGYLAPAPELALLLVRWAVVIAAFALLLGAVNLLRVHGGRFLRGKSGWPYSVFLLLAALVSFVVTAAGLTPAFLTEPLSLPVDVVEPVRLLSHSWFDYVIVPLEAGAAGLVAFALALGAFRLIRSRRRHTIEALVFLASALIVLLAFAPLPGPIGELVTAFPLAGMRGFLIGVGLGTVVIGLRMITGLDQPHSDT